MAGRRKRFFGAMCDSFISLAIMIPIMSAMGIVKQVAEGENPRDIKFELALELVARFHDAGAAELAIPLLVEAGVGDNWDEAH